MENFKADYISSFPLKEATKIDDIIYYDMPILSRYEFQGKNYLFYHVDDENSLDTYLVFKIEEYELFKLIAGKTSLRDTILNVDDFVYIIDVNYSNEVIKTALLLSNSIIEEYLPNEESILEASFIDDCYYSKLLKKHEVKYYTETLREKAFYLKFSSKTAKYGDTLGLEDLSEKILPKVTAAFKYYTKFDFLNKFSEQVTDVIKLNKLFNSLGDYLEPRLVNATYGSFEIGIAFDTLMKSGIEDKKINEWAISVGDEFKNDVIDIDLDNEEKMANIVNKFSEEQRLKIFKPIIDLSNNKDINFQYKLSEEAKFKKPKKPTEKALKNLIPTKKIEEIKEPEFEIINVTSIVEKGKTKTINLADSLFSNQSDATLVLTSDHFKKHNWDIILHEDIKVAQFQQGNKLGLLATYKDEKFTELIESKNLEITVEKLIKKIYEYYLNLKDL